MIKKIQQERHTSIGYDQSTTALAHCAFSVTESAEMPNDAALVPEVPGSPDIPDHTPEEVDVFNEDKETIKATKHEEQANYSDDDTHDEMMKEISHAHAELRAEGCETGEPCVEAMEHHEQARTHTSPFDEDFDEDFDGDLDAEDREYEERIARAAERRHEREDDDEPPFFALRAKVSPGRRLPDDALPPRLAKVAKALAILVCGTYDLVAILLLSFLNLVLQGHADVEVWGQARPISLFALIIAPSGGRKSSIYNRLVAPMEAFMRKLWAARAERDDESKRNGKKRGDDSDDPPVLIVQNTTEAAIVKFLSTSLGFMGLFVDEAAAFLGSYAMQKENFLGMIGTLSKLWDGAQVIVHRAGTGQRIIDRKRFALMLSSPRAPFNNLLGNPTVRHQGFLSRCLVVAPAISERDESTKEEIDWANNVLGRYDRFMGDMLRRRLPLVPGTTNDLNPRTLALTPQAKELLREFSREVKEFREKLPEEDPARDLCNKHPELAARIGATLALAEHFDTQEVDEASIRHGIIIARHCMSESIRMALPVVSNQHADVAERIANWMAQRNPDGATRTELQKASLGRKLTVAEFDPALKLLIDSGWVLDETTKRRGGGRTKHTYRLTRAARRELRCD